MDLEVIESNNGGELIKNKKDLSVINGFENMVYLGLFGGNVEQSTPSRRLNGEQSFDFWGNNLLMQGDSSIQLNSETERRLMTVALTSSGRVLIEESVRKDLDFMKEFADLIIQVSIISTDRIAIGVRIRRLDNLQRQDFIYIWDATNQELMDRQVIARTKPERVWDFSFDESF